jgi:Ca2+/Na+ antiporter
MSDDVAGATFMAAGSSSAELFLSLIALLQPGADTDDTGAGTIVGSAIFNVCITIGLSALFSPSEANEVRWRPIARDVVYNILAFSWVIGSFADNEIQWYEAMLGVMLYASYVVFMMYNVVLMTLIERIWNRCWKRCRRDRSPAAPAPAISTPQEFAERTTSNSGTGDEGTEMELVKDETTVERETTVESEQTVELENEPMSAPMMPGDHRFYVWKNICGRPIYRLQEGLWQRPTNRLEWVIAIVGFPFRFVFHFTMPNAENPTFPRMSVWFTFGICLMYLLGFTIVMVVSCQKIGCLLGMDEAVVGATLLAWGSSLPDALTSVFVARAGKGFFFFFFSFFFSFFFFLTKLMCFES